MLEIEMCTLISDKYLIGNNLENLLAQVLIT